MEQHCPIAVHPHLPGFIFANMILQDGSISTFVSDNDGSAFRSIELLLTNSTATVDVQLNIPCTVNVHTNFPVPWIAIFSGTYQGNHKSEIISHDGGITWILLPLPVFYTVVLNQGGIIMGIDYRRRDILFSYGSNRWYKLKSRLQRGKLAVIFPNTTMPTDFINLMSTDTDQGYTSFAYINFTNIASVKKKISINGHQFDKGMTLSEDVTGKVFLSVRYRDEYVIPANYLKMEISINFHNEINLRNKLSREVYHLFYYSPICNQTVEISQLYSAVIKHAVIISLGVGDGEYYHTFFRFNYMNLVERVTHEIPGSKVLPKVIQTPLVYIRARIIEPNTWYCIYTRVRYHLIESRERTFIMKFLKFNNYIQMTATSVLITVKLFGCESCSQYDVYIHRDIWVGWIHECREETNNLADFLTMIYATEFNV
ncbi:hypothetical protein RF11_14834 [Thelohanellus kitauei]|uniref:Uncharacterized protein n=1 Tax=Thelohanellus kitauei TaxID=669202 RepID=A0A0C2N2C0_THEKT|nr:hypothetical protein RF11_14834 [Thelohanellus kitauei]